MLRITHYATASTDSAAYVIGGVTAQKRIRGVRTSGRVSIIAEYKNNRWQAIGNLNQSKYWLSAIPYNGEHIVVGGYAGSDR